MDTKMERRTWGWKERRGGGEERGGEEGPRNEGTEHVWREDRQTRGKITRLDVDREGKLAMVSMQQ